MLLLELATNFPGECLTLAEAVFALVTLVILFDLVTLSVDFFSILEGSTEAETVVPFSLTGSSKTTLCGSS